MVEVEVGVSDISINSDDEDDYGARVEDGNNSLLGVMLSQTNH